MSNFLDELAALARNRVEVRAVLREFLDSGRVIANAQVNDGATLAAGHLVIDVQPSNEFGTALAALVADDDFVNPISHAFRRLNV